MFRYSKILFFTSLLILVFTMACSDSTSGGNDDPNGEEALLAAFKADEGTGVIKVMSRNIYIGTDVDVVLSAESEEQIPLLVKQAFDLLNATDFPTRADALAEEIEKTLPHLIGLQEVTTFYLQSPGDLAGGGQVPATEEYLNLLDELMDALTARGLSYNMVKKVENADIELPMLTGVVNGIPTFDDVRIVDHDVILARSDVVTSNPKGVTFQVALIDTSTGLVLPRSFVYCNAKVGDTEIVFSNTHLEAFDIEAIRAAQATELMATFANEILPVVMIGDFNAPAPSNSTYQMVLSGGYTDAWTKNTLTYNTTGYTWGHDADLKNTTVHFDRRIDFVFVKASTEPTYGESFVIGDEGRDIRNSLWPSDHGGVLTKLTF